MTDFYADLDNAVRVRAEEEGLFADDAFAYEMCARLETAEIVFDLTCEPVRCRGRRGKQLEVLGYAEDGADGSFIILVGRRCGDAGAQLNLAEIRKIFESGEAFLGQSIDGYLQQNLEPSSIAAEHADYFTSAFERATRVRMMLVTDAVMSDRVRSIDSGSLDGRVVSYEIWDRNRFESLAESPTGKEMTEIDFTRWLPDGLQVLAGGEGPSPTYVAILPGQVLADIFAELGSRLLESNVRTFLSARGKVNRGIQRTLAQEPEVFLAYNNGLTTTATAVYSYQDEGAEYVERIENWQIVNGGQTTASLHHFLRQGRGNSLEHVFIQMKLVLVGEEIDESDAQKRTAAISRNANSQNAVNEADFFSNSEFHQQMSRLSRRIQAPRAEGIQYATKWFYERTRGEYENTRNMGSASQQKRFDRELPKSQKIGKTDWARFQNVWDQLPHVVSRGAQSNFLTFAERVNKAYEDGPDRFGEEYFRVGVAKAILYGDLRKAVMKAPWYGNGYLANIVSYALAKFSHEVTAMGGSRELDFERIWALQRTPDALAESLLETARKMQLVLTDAKRSQANVTQWAKQEACWNSAKRTPIELPGSVGRYLVDRDVATRRRVDSRRTQKMDDGFALVERMLRVDRSVWDVVISRGPREGAVMDSESKAILNYGLKGRPAPEFEAIRMMDALNRCAERGIIAEKAY